MKNLWFKSLYTLEFCSSHEQISIPIYERLYDLVSNCGRCITYLDVARRLGPSTLSNCFATLGVRLLSIYHRLRGGWRGHRAFYGVDDILRV